MWYNIGIKIKKQSIRKVTMNNSKLSQNFISKLEISSYILVLITSFILGYIVIGKTPEFYSYDYLYIAIFVCLMISFILFLGLESFSKPGKDIYEIIITTAIPLVLINISTLFIFYFTKTLNVPRKVWLMALLIQFVGIVILQIYFTKNKNKYHDNKKIAIISSNEDMGNVLKKVDASGLMSKCSKIQINENEIKSLFDLKTLINKNMKDIDEIVISDTVSIEQRNEIIKFASQNNKKIYIVPNIYEIILNNSKLVNLSDMPTLMTNELSLSMESDVIKRLIDIIISVISLIILLPVMLIVGILIKLDGGPAFYKQERLTKGMQKFQVIKFRSMMLNAEQLSGPVLASEDDPRITKIGKFIRRTRLDEVPQFINVLKGDMSIIGPRPEREFFVNQFIEQVPEYKHRMNVKAGITGLAQVTGKYNTTFEDKLRYDLIYVSNYSIKMDLKILLKTIKVIFVRESTQGV